MSTEHSSVEYLVRFILSHQLTVAKQFRVGRNLFQFFPKCSHQKPTNLISTQDTFHTLFRTCRRVKHKHSTRSVFLLEKQTLKPIYIFLRCIWHIFPLLLLLTICLSLSWRRRAPCERFDRWFEKAIPNLTFHESKFDELEQRVLVLKQKLDKIGFGSDLETNWASEHIVIQKKTSEQSEL